MPSNTPNYNIPYPISTDPADISGDMGSIATYIDTVLKDNFSVNIQRVTSNTYTAVNRDFIIYDSTLSSLLTLFSPAQEGDFIRAVNFGTNSVTVTSLDTINGPTTILPQRGIMAIYTDNAWWCLPLSSSPDQSGIGWDRPNDWIVIPEPSAGDQVFYFIGKIKESSRNDFIFYVDGNYTVDWGDGVVEDYPIGRSSHSYDFNSVPSNTLTTDNLRQVLITITPQLGNNLISVASPSLFYEILLSSPYLTLYDINNNIKLSPESMIIKHNNSITTGLDSFFDWSFSSNIKNFYADLPNATTLSYIFGDVADIRKVVINSSSNLTNLYGMFIYGGAPELFISNTSGVTNFQAMFDWWGGSENEIPFMDTSSGTNFSAMFYGSPNIRSIPNFDLSNATDVSSMFKNCMSIEEIPPFDLSLVTSAGDFCYNAASLSKSNVTGLRVSHSYQYCNLNSIELNNIYSNLGLPLPGSSPTISVTGNPGTNLDNPSIAIDKGWQVIG